MKQYERKLIKADGTIVDYLPAGKTYTLEELQKAVGGYIEIHPVGPKQDFLLVLNEEGKIQSLPVNEKATELYGNPNDVVVGDVLVCRNGDVE